MHPDEEVLGAVGLTEMIVRPGDTSVAIGIGDLPIIAPSILINLMEHAAILSLDLFLEPEETTIPISLNSFHYRRQVLALNYAAHHALLKLKEKN